MSRGHSWFLAEMKKSTGPLRATSEKVPRWQKEGGCPYLRESYNLLWLCCCCCCVVFTCTNRHFPKEGMNFRISYKHFFFFFPFGSSSSVFRMQSAVPRTFCVKRKPVLCNIICSAKTNTPGFVTTAHETVSTLFVRKASYRALCVGSILKFK